MKTMEKQTVKATFMGATLAVALAGLSGCVLVIDESGDISRRESALEQQKYNRVAVPKIALGTTIDAVRDDLGEPHFAEAFTGADGEYRVLFYRTHRTKADGDTTRDETTPVVFRDGAVIGIGNDFYDRLVGR